MPKELKVLQIIDSLAMGGAERVCVNYANALSQINGVESFLCVARSSGPLFNMIDTDVKTLILNKKSSLDFNAIKTLRHFIIENKITHIHAHTSSFFIAKLVQLFSNVKIIWHLHNGEMKSTSSKHLYIMKLFSKNFSHIITVNSELNEWAQSVFKLPKKQVTYIENYPDLCFSNKELVLQGQKGKRLVSLANLRYQKDHMNLLEAFNELVKNGYDEWTLFLVGKDYKDDYSSNIKQYIQKNKLEKKIYILGMRADAADILKLCDIGVISSQVEGLPVSLLEYALASLAVVSTDVGECSTVLKDGEVGVLVEKQNSDELSQGLEVLMKDSQLCKNYASKYNKFINENYSKDVIIKKVVFIYEAS